ERTGWQAKPPTAKPPTVPYSPIRCSAHGDGAWARGDAEGVGARERRLFVGSAGSAKERVGRRNRLPYSALRSGAAHMAAMERGREEMRKASVPVSDDYLWGV